MVDIGQLMVQRNSSVKRCSFCNDSLELKEGVTFFDRKWYHDLCWSKLETERDST